MKRDPECVGCGEPITDHRRKWFVGALFEVPSKPNAVYVHKKDDCARLYNEKHPSYSPVSWQLMCVACGEPIADDVPKYFLGTRYVAPDGPVRISRPIMSTKIPRPGRSPKRRRRACARRSPAARSEIARYRQAAAELRWVFEALEHTRPLGDRPVLKGWRGERCHNADFDRLRSWRRHHSACPRTEVMGIS